MRIICVLDDLSEYLNDDYLGKFVGRLQPDLPPIQCVIYIRLTHTHTHTYEHMNEQRGDRVSAPLHTVPYLDTDVLFNDPSLECEEELSTCSKELCFLFPHFTTNKQSI